MKRLSPSEVADYLLEVGATLLSYGCPTHRLEGLLRVLAEGEGCEAEPFALPTGLFVGVRCDGGEQILRMTRVETWGVNLDRLITVDRIFNDVAERKCSIQEARARLDVLEHSPAPYPRWLDVITPAGATASAAVFFRGSPIEVALAGVGGVILGLMGVTVNRRPKLRFLSDFMGAVVAALFALLCTRVEPTLSREVLVLSLIILFVPGMALTNGLAELAHKYLVSGSGRVMEALMVFLSILFGVALVIGIEQGLGVQPGVAGERKSLGLLAEIAAMVLASVSFGVLFRMPKSHLPTAVLSGALAWGGTGFGTGVLPGHLAAFTGALFVCAFGNVLGNRQDRPAQLYVLPGMILLLPGSFGFLSLEAFLRGEFLGGAAKGFEMFLVGGALVTGILLANVLVPARKFL